MGFKRSRVRIPIFRPLQTEAFVRKGFFFFGISNEKNLRRLPFDQLTVSGIADLCLPVEEYDRIYVKEGLRSLEVSIMRNKYVISRSMNVKYVRQHLDDLIANVSKIGYLPEGAIACKYVHQIAQSKNIKLLICDGLYRILNREIEPEDFMLELLMGNK